MLKQALYEISCNKNIATQVKNTVCIIALRSYCNMFYT